MLRRTVVKRTELGAKFQVVVSYLEIYNEVRVPQDRPFNINVITAIIPSPCMHIACHHRYQRRPCERIHALPHAAKHIMFTGHEHYLSHHQVLEYH